MHIDAIRLRGWHKKDSHGSLLVLLRPTPTPPLPDSRLANNPSITKYVGGWNPCESRPSDNKYLYRYVRPISQWLVFSLQYYASCIKFFKESSIMIYGECCSYCPSTVTTVDCRFYRSPIWETVSNPAPFEYPDHIPDFKRLLFLGIAVRRWLKNKLTCFALTCQNAHPDGCLWLDGIHESFASPYEKRYTGSWPNRPGPVPAKR